MQVKFLLGPAGRGKTHRCLAEIRGALNGHPEGMPLVFLAPKQATYQLERQVLADSSLAGYSRLHILSFERLAGFVLRKLQAVSLPMLSPESRIMVLRSLLMVHENRLKLFRASSTRPGFALELSRTLAEFQQNRLTPARLRGLAGSRDLGMELRAKLHDLALLAEVFENWLACHGMQDAGQLLPQATQALRAARAGSGILPAIESLWVDGFAEFTPQELDFLAELVPSCKSATLAFCLDPVPDESAISIWSPIAGTYNRCRQRLSAVPGCECIVETLLRNPASQRFCAAPVLEHMETHWTKPRPWPGDPGPSIRILACADPAVEALQIAREIIRFVRQGCRFHDCAVLFRNLESSHALLARAFRRHGIPFFVDRREPVSHHPLAELTRGALRLTALDWRHEDWFAILKTGLCPIKDSDVDWLENLALEKGWEGRQWLAPLPDERAERLRQYLTPSFQSFCDKLLAEDGKPSGTRLAQALRQLWLDIGVEKQLEGWGRDANAQARPRSAALHAAVLEQMSTWLNDLETAFPAGNRRVLDWLPLFEAGMAGLSVGLVPPVLDEVLVGAVDRARNPSLKLTFVAGVNEGVFPAAPARPLLLTQADRADLAACNLDFGGNLLQQAMMEQYLGYIACTRPSMRLVLTFPCRQENGKPMKPSFLTGHLKRLFPALKDEIFPGDSSNTPETMQSTSEILAALASSAIPSNPARAPRTIQLPPEMQARYDRIKRLKEPDLLEQLSPALVRRIYGGTLKSSVSRLEHFGQCPFRFFVHSGLRAKERKVLELDPRQRGNFQHLILEHYHEEVLRSGKKWGDLKPEEAREWVGRIAAKWMPEYGNGLLERDGQRRFEARIMTAQLQDFVSTLTQWMQGQYKFNPVVAEYGFGTRNGTDPAWEIPLESGGHLQLQGKIDRVDICQDGENCRAVVMDYKSSAHRLDPVLMQSGIQLQLMAYLAVVSRWQPGKVGKGTIVPTGVFYVNLQGSSPAAGSRADALKNPAQSLRNAYLHSGRFDRDAVNLLDAEGKGDQFKARRNKDGSLRADNTEALTRPELEKLLAQVEKCLKEMGRDIFSGLAPVSPYRKGNVNACTNCDYRSVCRFNERIHNWRLLKGPSETPGKTSPRQKSGADGVPDAG